MNKNSALMFFSGFAVATAAFGQGISQEIDDRAASYGENRVDAAASVVLSHMPTVEEIAKAIERRKAARANRVAEVGPKLDPGSPNFALQVWAEAERQAKEALKADPVIERDRERYYQKRGIDTIHDAAGRVVPWGTKMLGDGTVDFGDLGRRDREIEMADKKQEAEPKRPYSPSRGGVMRRGDKVLIFPPTTLDHFFSPPPIVITPPSADELSKLPADPPNMSDDDFLLSRSKSFEATLKKYPFLADKTDARWEQLQVYADALCSIPASAPLFKNSHWPEWVADEAAKQYGWTEQHP